MDYKIVNLKNTIKKDGTVYLDLLSTSFDKTIDKYATPVIVNKYYVARPDLISLALYGDDSYGDVICKLNGISNPFELNEDMLIFAPNFETVRESVSMSEDSSDLVDGTDQISKNDTGFQKQFSDVRSPNEQIVGESNFIIDNSLGMVFY